MARAHPLASPPTSSGPHIPGERDESVFLAEWYDGLVALDDECFGREFWQHILGLREVVAKRIEELRNEKVLGASLEAEVELYCPEPLYSDWRQLGEELRFLLITSAARVHPLQAKPAGATTATLTGGHEIGLVVSATEHAKCARCWHHSPDVGLNADHPELCGRCVNNVAGEGEERFYA
ncbi:MAG: zinc finger domain-containing protein [Arhodomonas sp.]|nr:zinc finger domain-containing protein [Arhodomonas sp.]